MSVITLELSSEWVNALQPLADRPLDSFIKELAILELYRRRVISSHQAAHLLGQDLPTFLARATQQNITCWDTLDLKWQAILAETFGMWADRPDLDGVAYMDEVRQGNRLENLGLLP